MANTITKQEIEKNVVEWVNKHIQHFTFRPHQKEVIVELIYNCLLGEKYHIIDAPTGSGKSLINIISAGVMWDYYEKTSFILASDNFLFNQYVDYVKQHNLTDFGFVLGQTGNYTCPIDGREFRNATCSTAGYSLNDRLFSAKGISYNNISKCWFDGIYNNATIVRWNGYDFKFDDGTTPMQKFPMGEGRCGHAAECQYCKNLHKAQFSPITIMSYDLFFLKMNVFSVMFDTHDNWVCGYTARHLVFMDECHNIPASIQKRCRPVISQDDYIKMYNLFDYYKNEMKHKKNNVFAQNLMSNIEFKQKFDNYYKEMQDDTFGSTKNTYLLLNYTRFIQVAYKCGEKISAMLARKLKNGKKLTPKEWALQSDITWLSNYHCFLSDFCTAITIAGTEYTIKQISKNNVTFSCLREDVMIPFFLFKWGEHIIMTSATIGDKNVIENNYGFNTYPNMTKPIFYNVKSSFDFSKSPIYLYNKYKMSMSAKKQNMLPMCADINMILNNHNTQNGIIQTGSYENAKQLYKLLSPENKKRVLLYNGSKEKLMCVKQIKEHTNYVLIGPSLNEGIDLPGDLCAFIIIMKIPFLSIGDKYVNKKMKMFKGWYNSVVTTNLIQGIGRGNRFDKDFCDIYIMDKCFDRLFKLTKSQFPDYVTNRFINLDSIYEHEITYAETQAA